jgi:hypothetical protein
MKRKIMKNKILYMVLLLSIFIFSCSKDKEDAPAADVKGYWRGYIGEATPAAYIAIINHSDGNSRAYVDLTHSDTTTATVEKMNGRWKMINGVFYGSYKAPPSFGHDSILLQGIIQPSFIEMRGMFLYSDAVGGIPFRIVKME